MNDIQFSIWEKETFFAPQDVIIAGSGFSGLWAAYYLKKNQPALKITILERGPVPTGASTRNAGFACFGSLSEVVRDARTMGKDTMLELAELRYRGLKRIQKHFPLVDFELSGGYELYHMDDATSTEEIDENINYINLLFRDITGSKKTYKRADDELSLMGFGKTRHLIKNKFEGALHSGKLVAGLLQKVQGMGVQVLSQVHILSYDRNNEGFTIQTNIASFTSKKLLLCTNAFTKQLLPDIDIVPARGQILLTSPVQNLTWKGTFHSDEGFYYFRNLGDRVLLGGARNKAFQEEETTEMYTTDFIQQELENYLSDVVLPQYKGQYTIEHRWSGIMAMGSEKSPIVKELEPDLYCAVRMSGMGVALAPMTGQVIAELMY